MTPSWRRCSLSFGGNFPSTSTPTGRTTSSPGYGSARSFTCYVIVHGTEGHLIPDLLAEEGAGVITGPCLGDRSKPELANQSLETPAILQRHGVKTAICTDHPETPIQYLPLCAAMAVRGGMDPESALACITIRAAELAGVAHRVGSLAPGKDADLTVTSSHPLNWLSRVRLVVMDGKVVVSSL